MSSLFGKSKRKRAPPSRSSSVAQPSEHSTGSKDSAPTESSERSLISSFEDLGLSPHLCSTCRSLGFRRPTPVQRTIIPEILNSDSHVLALAATGSGKTAAFALPILQTLSLDPYGIYAVVLTPTRELAKQIQEQIVALGTSMRVQSVLVVGGMDQVRQSCDLDRRPHFVVATPGRLAELLRGPCPPMLRNVRYVVLDEADRLLSAGSGFERDVAEVLLHSTTVRQVGRESVQRRKCQTLLFSATLTRSLESLEEMAGAGLGRLPLKKFVIRDDDVSGGGGKPKKKMVVSHDESSNVESNSEREEEEDPADKSQCVNDEEAAASTVPRIPSGLRQEYVFMPSRVRDAYLVTVIRTMIINGGRRGGNNDDNPNAHSRRGWNNTNDSDSENEDDLQKARSSIIFVSTCERAGKVSGILTELGVQNVCLHSLLSQNRRIAALAKFKSEHVRIMVATDVASRGLDIPTVDLVINSELPRRAVDYVHRVGRTARAGRRGRAVSLVGETDVALVHAAEEMSGRQLEKCPDVTEDMAIRMLGPVTKASRLANMKLMDIGFDELVKKMKQRKAKDRRERHRAERAAAKAASRLARQKGAGNAVNNDSGA